VIKFDREVSMGSPFGRDDGEGENAEPPRDIFETMVRELCSDSVDRDHVTDGSFARFLVNFGPLSICFERMVGVYTLPDIVSKQRNVTLAPWFRLDLDMDRADRWVTDEKKNGRFVIRRSGTNQSLVLVYFDGQRALNSRLKLTDKGYNLQGDPRYYESIRRLVITVATEKGLDQSASEVRHNNQWAEFIRKEQAAIVEERKAARYAVNTYDELASFLGVVEEDKFRKVERTILECIFDGTTKTPFAEIFLQLDSDYSGALHR